MNPLLFQIVIGAVGAFISVALVVNGFFIKQMVVNLGNVDKGLAVLVTRHDFNETRIKKNEKDTEKNSDEIFETRKRVHDLVSELNAVLLRVENLADVVEKCQSQKGECHG